MGKLATTWALAVAALGSGVMATGSVTAGEIAGGNAELQLKLSFVGRYDSGIRAESGAEIVQHDPGTQRLFTINAKAASVDVLDAANP
ncbi:MAG: choice-of-anchor I family protein, partial [Panacagrimonas sp.]